MDYLLEEIKGKYVEVSAAKEPIRTKKLTILMGILEKQHGTLQMHLTEAFLATEAMKLYRETGDAWIFQE